MYKMKILIIDRKLQTANWDQKEGEVLKSAFEKLGHTVVIAGKGYENNEHSIVDLSKGCDFAFISENYWEDWSWWNINEIKIPKYFWAIDYDSNVFGTRMVQLVTSVSFDGVFTIDSTLNDYMEYSTGRKHYYLPYAIFNEPREIICEKDTDILFIGSPYEERKKLFPKDTVFKNGLFGHDYYEAIGRAKVNLNWSLTDAINGKVFEIISAKGFLITNRTKQAYNMFNGFIDMYSSKEDLEKQVKEALNDEEYRNKRRNALYSYCLASQSYLSRAKTVIETVTK